MPVFVRRATRLPAMEGGVQDVGIRAAEHALDAALAEHRRAVRLAADARERERIARGHALKDAAAATDAALAQPVDRPMRGVRLGETWIEVERVRHPLTDSISAQLGDAELRVTGEDWSARLVLAPGPGPLRAASEAAARIKAGSRGARDAAHRRLYAASELGREHAAACHAAATALAAGDREVAQLHADRARLDNCLDELAARLGHRTPGEPAEVAAARGRLEQARVYLGAPTEQPFAWVSAWPKHVSGLMLRDLPEPAAVEAPMRELLAELRGAEELLALAAAGDGVVASTSLRVVRVGAPEGEPLAEQQPGRLAAFAELVRGAGG
jgi:hypothetical protein